MIVATSSDSVLYVTDDRALLVESASVEPRAQVSVSVDDLDSSDMIRPDITGEGLILPGPTFLHPHEGDFQLELISSPSTVSYTVVQTGVRTPYHISLMEDSTVYQNVQQKGTAGSGPGARSWRVSADRIHNRKDQILCELGYLQMAPYSGISRGSRSRKINLYTPILAEEFTLSRTNMSSMVPEVNALIRALPPTYTCVPDPRMLGASYPDIKTEAERSFRSIVAPKVSHSYTGPSLGGVGNPESEGKGRIVIVINGSVTELQSIHNTATATITRSTPVGDVRQGMAWLSSDVLRKIIEKPTLFIDASPGTVIKLWRYE